MVQLMYSQPGKDVVVEEADSVEGAEEDSEVEEEVGMTGMIEMIEMEVDMEDEVVAAIEVDRMIDHAITAVKKVIYHMIALRDVVVEEVVVVIRIVASVSPYYYYYY